MFQTVHSQQLAACTQVAAGTATDHVARSSRLGSTTLFGLQPVHRYGYGAPAEQADRHRLSCWRAVPPWKNLQIVSGRRTQRRIKALLK